MPLHDYTKGTTLVSLDPVEVQTVEVLASLRHSRHLFRANGRSLGGAFSGRDEDLQGLLGEYAVGKALNRWVSFVIEDPWAPENHYDVGKLYQVRTTRRQDGHLIVYDSDPPDDVFVLARLWGGADGRVEVRVGGWIWGRDAQVDQWWQRKQGPVRSASFWVPVWELRPMTEIPNDAVT